jgi:8-oxo-dGTP pyrophosphatase MutT (NUDIX family)
MKAHPFGRHFMVYQYNKMATHPAFKPGGAWAHYKPLNYKVYGCICVSPKNRIALVKGRSSGKWSFPKGHMKRGESSLNCALRELREETSIHLTREREYSRYKYLASGGYFIYDMEEEAEMLPEDSMEIEECGWFSPSEIAGMNCNVDVNRYLSFLRSLRCEDPNSPTPLDVLQGQNTTQETDEDAKFAP